MVRFQGDLWRIIKALVYMAAARTLSKSSAVPFLDCLFPQINHDVGSFHRVIRYPVFTVFFLKASTNFLFAGVSTVWK